MSTPRLAARREAGERLGPYRILGVLGAGGMGVVYRAAHADSGEEVALKTVNVPREGDLEGIRREARWLMGVRHPGVARFLGEGVEDGVPWIATELLEGGTLEGALRELWAPGAGRAMEDARSALDIGEDTTSPVERTEIGAGHLGQRARPAPRRLAAGGRLAEMLTMLRALCEALAFLHGEGIVHRDLKPANIILRRGDGPVLVDFGVAHRLPARVAREEIDTLPAAVGTPSYMAPEQILGEGSDARADLYALGCIMYEVVTGKVPFQGQSLTAIFSQHLQVRPVPPSMLVDAVPPALDALILRLLEKRPRDRVGYAADVASALASLGAAPPASPGGAARDYVYQPGLVEREDVLGTLETRIRELARGEGGALLLRGESGIGKTAVAAAAARAAQRRGITVVAGACASVAAGARRAAAVSPGGVQWAVDAALHPFQPLLRAAADRCLAEGPLGVVELLGERAKILAACAPWMGDLPGVAALPDPPPLPALANQDRLLAALRDVLVLLAEPRGLLLILDDLQWADEVSLKFLASLPGWIFEQLPVRILGTCRAEEPSPALEELGATPPWSRIDLGRLDARGVGVMVADMLALAEPPASLVHFLTARSEGNPFYVAEYLRAAVVEGLLRRTSAGVWQLAGSAVDAAAFEELSIPRSLRDLVARHLAALPAPARELALAASVLGKEVDLELLAQISGAPVHAHAAALQELLTRQLFEEAAPGRVRFLHDKLQDLAYETLAPERRRALHRSAALALEARGSGPGGSPPAHELLAHHFLEAGERPKAMEHLEKAGEQALKVSANRQACGFFRELLALAEAEAEASAPAPLSPGERAQRARWERHLVEAALALGDTDSMIQHAERALAWAGFRLPGSKARWVDALLANVPIQAVHRLLPRAFQARDAQQRALLTEASMTLATIGVHFFFSDAPRAFAAGLWSINLGEQAGSGPHLSQVYAGLGALLGACRIPGLSRLYFTMSRASAEAGDALDVANAAISEAVWHIGEARWDRARALSAEAAASAARLGARYEQAFFLTAAFSAEIHPGRLRAAREIAGRILRLGEDIGNPQVILWGLHTAGYAALHLGRLEDAEAALRRADTLIGRTQGAMARADQATLRAALSLHRGDAAAALDAADAHRALVRQQSNMTYVQAWMTQFAADFYLSLSERAARAGERDLAARTQRRAAEVVERLWLLSRLFPLARPWAARARARLRWLHGAARNALDAWLSSVAAAKALGMPYDEALAHADLARVEAPGSSAREAHVRRAAALFEEMGCEAPPSTGRGAGARP